MGCLASGQKAVTDPGQASECPGRVEPEPAKIAALVDMGFSDKIARQALEACSNDYEKAVQDATERTAAESAKRFQDAQQILGEVEDDLVGLESGSASGASDPKHLVRLADAVTRASCTLDGISVTGDTELRNARREQLARCDRLEGRIQALKVSASKEVVADSVQNAALGENAGPTDATAEEVLPVDAAVAADTINESGPASAAGEGPKTWWDVPESSPLAGSATAPPTTVQTDAAPKVAPAPAMPTTTQAAAHGASQAMPTTAQAATPVASQNGSSAQLPTDMRIAGAECLRLAGNTAFKEGNFEVAADRYREALTLDAQDTAILSNLAAAEIRLGHFSAAAEHACAADKLSGGFSAKALFRKGQALEGLGQLAEACTAYEASLHLEPSDPTTKRCLEACRASSASPAGTQAAGAA